MLVAPLTQRATGTDLSDDRNRDILLDLFIELLQAKHTLVVSTERSKSF